jgi:hypothetical protein
LPVKYRALDPDSRDESGLPKLNIKYRELLDLCRNATRLAKTKTPDATRLAVLMAEIETAVAAVFEFCLGLLNGKVPKEGLLRRHGLGRRVDCSGRLVIVPDPELSPAACKVPTHILWELLSSDIVQWLKEAEEFFSGRQSGRLAVAKAFAEADAISLLVLPSTNDLYERRYDILQKKLLDFHTASALRARTVTDGAVEDLCLRTLQGFLKAHPEKLLILNRQPSLHKYSVLAFRPIPTPMSEGEVLRLSPIVCGSFGADFDGDEMALHWPLSDDAHQEARRLLFRNNLISEANGRPLAHFTQDIVLGIYLLKKRKNEDSLYNILPDRDQSVKCCRAMIESNKEWDEAAGIELLRHICLMHADEAELVLQQLFESAFHSATVAGNSLGYFDLCPPQAKSIEVAIRILDTMGGPGSTERTNVDILNTADKALAKVTMAHLQKIVQSPPERPGHGMAAMAVSGARGAGQATQLLTMRGRLGPGALGFDAKPIDFFFRHSLAVGCNRETYYRTVYNGRSSMCDKKLGTGKAGWLTRELVGAMWDVVVAAGDCGAVGEGESSLATCNLTHGICQHCYGRATSLAPQKAHWENVLNYVDPATGFYKGGYPAGLIAAQSIGERGTQLSMQSFHTAKRAFTPDSVRKLLNTPALFDFASFALLATEWDDAEKEQFHELAEALYKLVPDLRILHEKSHGTSGSVKAKITKAIKTLMADVLRDPGLTTTADAVFVSQFVALFQSIKAYEKILPRHLVLLWRMIHGSREKKLSRLTSELPPLAALGFCPIRATLYRLASEGKADPLVHPASKIIVGSYCAEK